MSLSTTTPPASSPPARWRTLAAHGGAAALILLVVLYLFFEILSDLAFQSWETFWLYLRVQQYAVELAAGHFPPRVFPDAVAGGGSAFPFFHPPLAYWLSAFLGLFLGDMVVGVNVSFLLSVLLSAWAMYGMGMALTGRRWLALMGALLYVSLPYRFVSVFVTGALEESWSFVWYPLVLTGAWRTVNRERLSWLLPLAVAALLLTHSVMALYFLGLCALVLAGCGARLGWRGAGRVAAGGLLGGALTLWHFLPARLSLPDVWADVPEVMRRLPGFVHGHRVQPWQWFDEHPNRWNGISTFEFDSMCFSLGAAQWVVLAVAAGAYTVVARRGLAVGDARLTALAKGLAVLWAGCLLFMVAPLPFLSVLPEAFSAIQFPWRLLGVTAFLSLAAAGLFLARAPISPRLGAVISSAALVLALSTPPFQRTNSLVGDWDDAAINRWTLRRNGASGYTANGEYLPRSLPVEQWVERVSASPVPGGGIQVLGAEREGSRWSMRVDAPQGGPLVLPVVAYDFYRATGEGERTLETFSEQGLLGVRLLPGQYTFTVEPGTTPAGWVGTGLGVAALGAVLFLASRRRGSGLLAFTTARRAPPA
ncbi:hypothetical protein ATI61_107294 [Archangium gephyra]|uniref:Membrane protein 6-pyruvoyl-tetrahydropterin synthase-related domain-containing protein n=1 Tax=Archangium gephyra TaxID=48 RepID=A0ABX9JYI6_9BACT|nr:hypothetical protein [Archangium gephyra]REG29598.1 hypothetical protein ATI61_107294 [Archangium gephyra]